jgi:hypothetical protein
MIELNGHRAYFPNQLDGKPKSASGTARRSPGRMTDATFSGWGVQWIVSQPKKVRPKK